MNSPFVLFRCVAVMLMCCADGVHGADPAHALGAGSASPSHGAYASVHGLKMYYEVRGEGSALVILHGGLASIPVWPEAMEFFAREFRVIAPEQMGHGRTADDPKRVFSYHGMAEDTIELLRQLGVTSACLLGWSDGGIIGLDLAMNHPDSVQALAISGANFSPPPATVPRRRRAPESIPTFLHDPYVRLSPDGPAHWPIFVSRVEDMWWSQPNYSKEDLGRIQARTLVIAGDHDFMPPEETVALWRAIPQAELWIAPNGTHALPKTMAPLFNATVLSFFQRAMPTAPARGQSAQPGR